MTWLERVTWASPTLVRGMSVLPVWRPLMDHSVCPMVVLGGRQGEIFLRNRLQSIMTYGGVLCLTMADQKDAWGAGILIHD